MPIVRFLDEDRQFDCPSGTPLSAVAASNGVELIRGIWPGAQCRTLGICGRCKVWVTPGAEGATSPKSFWERIRPKVTGSVRLACQTRVLGDIEVRTRPGAAAVAPNLEWQPDPRHFKWQDRLNAKDEAEEGAGEAKAAKKAVAAKKPAANEATGAVAPANAVPAVATTTVEAVPATSQVEPAPSAPPPTGPTSEPSPNVAPAAASAGGSKHE